MGLEDEVRQRLDGAVSGISRPLAIDARDPLGRLSTANMEVIARVVEAQSDALVRLAREIDQLRASAAVGDDER